ncbi:MAG: hypothetical protein AAF701_04870 [Pseudomonadota bacterium]
MITIRPMVQTDIPNCVRIINHIIALGGTAILAKITSDNASGLAFYSNVGFTDWKTIPNDHQRPDGTWVDRIIKRFDL